MKIYFYNKDLENFVASLEKPVIAKVLRTIDLLEEFGNNLSLPHSKKITSQLFELRIHGKQEVRIFYAFHKNSVVLLHGFVKKSRRVPKKEINLALQRLKTFA